jgi:uncharacterized membrane protein
MLLEEKCVVGVGLRRSANMMPNIARNRKIAKPAVIGSASNNAARAVSGRELRGTNTAISAGFGRVSYCYSVRSLNNPMESQVPRPP